MSSSNERHVNETEVNQEKKKIKIPHTYAILMGVITLAAILTHIIPAGVYDRVEKDGQTLVVDGSYHRVDQNPFWFFDIFTAIPKGMVEGGLIIFYIFLVGGAFGIIRKTDAIESVINKGMFLLKGNEKFMIVGIMFIFSLLGVATGMAEEVIIFVPVGIVLAKAMGYDAMVGTAMVTIGAASGFIGGMLNPFTVMIAQQIAEIQIFSGWGYRTIVYIIILFVSIMYVMNYAKKVKKDPKKSIVYEENQNGDLNFTEDISSFDKFQKRHLTILAIFALGILFNIYGIFELDWYLEELAANFFLIALICGLIGGLGINGTFEAFIEGMKLIVFGAIIVGFAHAVLVVLQEGKIIDTVIYALANSVKHLPSEISVVGMFILQSFINFFIPSGSGQAATTMPIMAPLSDLLGVNRQIAVMAYQYGDAISNSIIPTSAPLMGVLAVAGIPYIKWVKFIWKLVLIWSVIAASALVIAVILNIQ
ncbi:YfcC family protein [Abyssicoccus albus]|uniref:YfcC family protein n=1 Tax=Abyssicoccus albus TaxID=1817405 RepID=UPI00097E205F|nr:TIGR00366 family protein [Abyssicoccus albus]AQL56496.1 C4-dicarboxylate ABC transporter permease [Abyssicoccus albus]